MTLVGKIFTMLIFVMSILFMAFAVMVFATHRNWKEYVTNPTTGLQKQLDLAKQAKTDADAQMARLKEDLRNEQAARASAIGVLTARAVRLEADLSAKTAGAGHKIGRHDHGLESRRSGSGPVSKRSKRKQPLCAAICARPRKTWRARCWL